MRSSLRPISGPGFLLFIAILIGGAMVVHAGQKQRAQKPIDIDAALQGDVPQNMAMSYYHYSLAKWYEDRREMDRALSEMQTALKYNRQSPTLRVDLASLLYSNGDVQGCIREAEEASRLDPENPEPHWLLVNVYLTPRTRGAPVTKEMYLKAADELKIMRRLAPEDERAYYTMGRVYFELDEPEKAIEAYEKFQSLVPNADIGYSEIAEYYDKTGNHEKKIEYLGKALESQPNSTPNLVKLADALSSRGRSEEAVPLYRKALEISGNNRMVQRRLASSLIDLGEFEQAASELEQLAKADSSDPAVRVLLGRARLGEKRFDEAIEIFEEVLEDNPADMEAEFYLADAQKQGGNLVSAARILSRLLEKTEKGPEELRANRLVFQQHLAETYQQMGENQKAIALYEKMVAEQPTEDPRIVFYLVNAYRIERQFDKALSLGKQQFEKHPDNVGIALVYARTLCDAGSSDEGADILRGLLEENPRDIDIYINLSQIYLQDKKYSEAEDILRLAEEKNLDRERVMFQLATVFEQRKDFDRAESLFREILKENPRNATALNYIGYMLADRGVRLDEAVRYVQEALELEPNNGAYLDSLGWAFFKLNELEKAEEYLLRAVELVRNDPVIHDHLGDLYYKTGDLEKAEQYWEKSLTHGTEPDDIEAVREKLEKLRSNPKHNRQ